MSFKAYINNVEKATGKSIAELTELAFLKGFVSDDGCSYFKGKRS